MSGSDRIRIEACVTSVRSAIAAQEGGAVRVELCDNLHDGGTTPGPGSIVAARKYLDIELNVIIRPRGGDFLYNDLEFEIMKTEIEQCGDYGVDGVVFGILAADGTVDRKRSAELTTLAGDMSTTFHRAFDMTRDPFAALNDLNELGLDRVLTSGQRPSALAGIDLITQLVEATGDTIIMPGVGITADNIARIVTRSGAREFHVHTQQPVPSDMEFRNDAVFMGTSSDVDEYATDITDSERIRAICDAAQRETGTC